MKRGIESNSASLFETSSSDRGCGPVVGAAMDEFICDLRQSTAELSKNKHHHASQVLRSGSCGSLEHQRQIFLQGKNDISYANVNE
jgi:hypothetical protein